mgnify:CR=1 FL=1
MKTDKNNARSYSAFNLLRHNRGGWRIDAVGFWSYPAMVATPDGKLLWIFMVLQAEPLPEKKRTALFRPKAIVVTRANTPDIVRYENLHTSHDPFPSLAWDKPLAMFPHKSVGNLSYKDYEIKEGELLNAYPAAGDVFLKTKKLPDAFVKQYIDLIHPVFLPFIRHLTPQFFAALGVENAGKD